MDYKVTASELTQVANAIRVKGGTSATLQYPSEFVSAIQNINPVGGGTELTPADPTAEYKTTDTELTAIADAIRAKGGTSAPLEFPDEYVLAIQNLQPPVPQGKTFGGATDAEFTQIIQAAHDGIINLQEYGWALGDTRTIPISEFTGGGNRVCPAQNATIVLTSFNEYANSGNVLQFDFRQTLSQTFRMNDTSTNAGGFSDSEMRNVTIPALVDAMPTYLKDLLVTFSAVCGTGGGGKATITVNNNKLALRSYFEYFNNNIYAFPDNEGQYVSYYDSNEKRARNTVSWMRSPYADNAKNYGYLSTNGGGYQTTSASSTSYGIAPFGCL